MVADEPQSLVSLATALGAPVAAVRQAIERLVADYDGENGGVAARLRAARGRWRLAHLRARRNTTTSCATSCSPRTRRASARPRSRRSR